MWYINPTEFFFNIARLVFVCLCVWTCCIHSTISTNQINISNCIFCIQLTACGTAHEINLPITLKSAQLEYFVLIESTRLVCWTSGLTFDISSIRINVASANSKLATLNFVKCYNFIRNGLSNSISREIERERAILVGFFLEKFCNQTGNRIWFILINLDGKFE